VLTAEDIAGQIERYRTSTLAERRSIPGLQPKRAEVILAGACILRVIARRLGAEQLTISDRGLRHGLAYDMFHK
jgi:exopolyphosphatase/guanosine-5'-triphosphate,3'-diphosphate pyrophosphatase